MPSHRGPGGASYRLREPGRNLASAPEPCRGFSRYPPEEWTLSFDLYPKQLLRTMSYNEISAIDNPNAQRGGVSWAAALRFFQEEGERKGKKRREGRKARGVNELLLGTRVIAWTSDGGARTSAASRSCVTQGSLTVWERTLRICTRGKGRQGEGRKPWKALGSACGDRR